MSTPTPDHEVTASGRLRLRRPTGDDLDVVFEIHSDPRTNVHNPAGPDPDRDASSRRLDEWLQHWDHFGFGYWVVETTDPSIDRPSAVVGFSGLRNEVWLEQPVLNLYYRLAAQHWGQGYAREVARHAVGWARDRQPDLPVRARTTLDNFGSQRTAAAAGLVRRQDLEKVDANGIHEVIFVSHWPRC